MFIQGGPIRRVDDARTIDLQQNEKSFLRNLQISFIEHWTIANGDTESIEEVRWWMDNLFDRVEDDLVSSFEVSHGEETGDDVEDVVCIH
jgi:hypothetical protein